MYRFDRFTLDEERSVLWLDGAPLALAPKVVDTLSLLVERAGQVTAKSELMDRLWPDGFVEESNLTQNIYVLRRTFAAHGLRDAIETLPRRGYRFKHAVNVCEPKSEPTSTPSLPRLTAAIAAALLLCFFAGSSRFATTPGSTLQGREAQLYGLGRYAWSLRTVPALHRSVTYFNELLRLKPGNALAYAGLSDAYMGLYDYECDGKPCAQYSALAQAFARRAVTADPRSAEAHTSLAMTLRVFDRNYPASDAEFRKAIALNAGYALAHEWYGNSLLVRGMIAQARIELERAATIDPVSPATLSWLARDAYFAHRYSEAVTYAREALAIDPHRFETRVLLGLAYEELNDRTRALSTLVPLHAPVLLAGAYAHFAERGTATAILRASNGNDADAAAAFVALHEYGRALEYLRRVHFHDETQRAFFLLDPRFDAVRADPRFRRWTTEGSEQRDFRA